MSAWVVRPAKRPSADIRLVCFPYAGGGAGVYRTWAPDVPESIELCAVQAPGREERIAEEPLTNFRELVAGATDAIEPLLDRPYAVFGHSLGALAGFEVVRELEARGHASPLVFMPSGRRAPGMPAVRSPICGLPDHEFLVEISRSSGPDASFDEFVKHPELVELLMPLLRADFALAEGYEPLAKVKLRCAISALASHDDAQAQPDMMEPWRAQTTGDFTLHYFPGRHLYINQHRALVARYVVSEVLRQYAGHRTGSASAAT